MTKLRRMWSVVRITRKIINYNLSWGSKIRWDAVDGKDTGFIGRDHYRERAGHLSYQYGDTEGEAECAFVDRLGFFNGDEPGVADLQQGMAVEHDGGTLLHSRLSDHRANGAVDPEV